jgi:hypothetical protein
MHESVICSAAANAPAMKAKTNPTRRSKMKMLPTLLSAFLMAGPALSQAAVVIYSNDFEGDIGPEWSTNRVTASPAGKHRFLGEFTEEAVQLVVTNLPPGHTKLTISLRLLALRQWTGGSRLWRLRVDGNQVYRGAFSSVAGSSHQNYPQAYANAWYPPCSDASETNTLGYTNACADCGDATYDLRFTIAHEATTVVLEFSADDLYGSSQPPTWGIDDLELAVGLPSVAITTPAFNTLYCTPTNIMLTATASSPSTNIAKVQFWANRALVAEVTNAPYRFEWVNVPAGTHFLRARAIDASGFSNEAKAVLKVNGLYAEYFYAHPGGENLMGNRNTRFDPQPVWRSGDGNPIADSWSYYASVRWTGEIEAPETGYYTFYAWRLDDGCRLWLDERRLIDTWGPPGNSSVTYASAPVFLLAGSRHSFTMDFQQIYTRGGRVELFWQYGSQAPCLIPQRYFYPYHPGPNRPPNVPVITSPAANAVVGPDTVTFATDFFSDPDTTRATPQRHERTEYELYQVWMTGTDQAAEELAWHAQCTAAPGLLQTNLAGGTFTNTHAGRQSLKPGTAYRLQVRYRDNSSAQNAWSQWAHRTFFTGPETGTMLVGSGATWRYLDTGADPGEAWRQPDFDDSAWSAGPAPLGYSTGAADSWIDAHHGTTVRFGPDPNWRILTTYFRTEFVVPSAASVEWFTLELLRDDGAVVFLNGQEVWRDNLPAAVPITPTDQASAAISGTAEDRYLLQRLPSSLLRTGANVLTVEVHQVNPTSTDLHFDLQLYAVQTSRPKLALQPTANDLVVSWPASAGWRLEWTTNLNPPVTWMETTNTPIARAGTNWVSADVGTSLRFYRLVR